MIQIQMFVDCGEKCVKLYNIETLSFSTLSSISCLTNISVQHRISADHINSLTSHLNFGRNRINIKADHMNLNAYVFQAKAYQIVKLLNESRSYINSMHFF